MNTIELNKNGSVTSPKGFKATGITAGLKKSGKPDLALIKSEFPTVTAGAFTSNLFAAAPVVWDRKLLAAGHSIRAVVINSGIANACTGKQGYKDTQDMATQVATLLNLKPEEVFVSSTGRIGVPMPMDIIRKGIAKAAASLRDDGGILASEAIITTDTYPKHISASVIIDGKRVTIGGMTKGAGMIAPQMKMCRPPQATMLSYITTDAAITREALNACLSESLEKSYNRIIIDGDTSTNDTLVCIANGQAGNPQLTEKSASLKLFSEALNKVSGLLAKEMVLDGEGVSSFIELNICGAHSDSDARKCAEAIARSPLCKTAWFGCDPNWGRILDAAGYSGILFDPEKVQLDYENVPVVRNGVDAGTPEKKLAEILHQREMSISLDLGSGTGKFTLWTCDLTYQYVKINAEYHT
ncbi:MAG: bifunctional glutamate N-acetyltransferase/amino-acid acetyltransferase ArgJ [Lentisphaeria bacterium]